VTLHLVLFLQPIEIFIDDESKMTLHGLKQHFVQISEAGKIRKLIDLLDTLEFDQVMLLWINCWFSLFVTSHF
jgi:hypothetical protein